MPVIAATATGGSCPTAGSRRSWTLSTRRCGTMIARVPASLICCHSPCSRAPPAAFAACALLRWRSASASSRRSRTRSAVICSARGRSICVATPFDGRTVTGGELAGVRDRAARRPPLGPGRDAREHEQAREAGRAASASAPSAGRGGTRDRARRRGTSNSTNGRAAQTRVRAPEQGDLRPELGRRRRDQQHREQRDRDRVDPAAGPLLRDRLRVGDHEEEEDQDLGREARAPARTRSRSSGRGASGAVIACPLAAITAIPAAKTSQKVTAIAKQVEAREDRERADEDDREREHHPGRHRPPPEGERVGPASRRAAGSRATSPKFDGLRK